MKILKLNPNNYLSKNVCSYHVCRPKKVLAKAFWVFTHPNATVSEQSCDMMNHMNHMIWCQPEKCVCVWINPSCYHINTNTSRLNVKYVCVLNGSIYWREICLTRLDSIDCTLIKALVSWQVHIHKTLQGISGPHHKHKWNIGICFMFVPLKKYTNLEAGTLGEVVNGHHLTSCVIMQILKLITTNKLSCAKLHQLL